MQKVSIRPLTIIGDWSSDRLNSKKPVKSKPFNKFRKTLYQTALKIILFV